MDHVSNLRPQRGRAVGLEPKNRRDTGTGALTADLEAAAHQHIGVTLLDAAPDPVAYRVFRDGVVLVERNHHALAERRARAILGDLDFPPLEEVAVRGVLAAAAVVDRRVIAARDAAFRDAVARIRESSCVLPSPIS